MAAALSLVRVLPVGFAARCCVALVEIVLAATILSGAVIVGHELHDWRSWYGDPTTTHPWAPTPRDTPVGEAPAR